MDPAWLEFEAQVLHVQTDAVKTPTEASITWVQRLALNRWGLRSHGRPRVEKTGWLGGSFWNISWTVLKQFCALNAMVARVWCHLTRTSSKIAKATVILKPPTSAGEAPLQRRRRFPTAAGTQEWPGRRNRFTKPDCTPYRGYTGLQKWNETPGSENWNDTLSCICRHQIVDLKTASEYCQLVS